MTHTIKQTKAVVEAQSKLVAELTNKLSQVVIKEMESTDKPSMALVCLSVVQLLYELYITAPDVGKQQIIKMLLIKFCGYKG